MRTEQFEFNGRVLNVVAIEDDGNWVVTVREDGHTVGRMEYRATHYGDTCKNPSIDEREVRPGVRPYRPGHLRSNQTANSLRAQLRMARSRRST